MTFRHRTEKGQHFLQDGVIVRKFVAEAQLSPKDTVLEIGAGVGNITSELAKAAGKVIAVEIDVRLKKDLLLMPQNVQTIIADALDVLRQRDDFHKVIGNIPFQLAEPLLHHLCTAQQVERSVLIVPKTFAEKAQRHPIFSAFLEITILRDVPKSAFYPRSRTDCSIVAVQRRKNIDDTAFLCQQLYLQKDKKLKNALREALIELYAEKGKTLTKKQALQMVDSLNLPEKWLETLIPRVPAKIYLCLRERMAALNISGP